MLISALGSLLVLWPPAICASFDLLSSMGRRIRRTYPGMPALTPMSSNNTSVWAQMEVMCLEYGEGRDIQICLVELRRYYYLYSIHVYLEKDEAKKIIIQPITATTAASLSLSSASTSSSSTASTDSLTDVSTPIAALLKEDFLIFSPIVVQAVDAVLESRIFPLLGSFFTTIKKGRHKVQKSLHLFDKHVIKEAMDYIKMSSPPSTTVNNREATKIVKIDPGYGVYPIDNDDIMRERAWQRECIDDLNNELYEMQNSDEYWSLQRQYYKLMLFTVGALEDYAMVAPANADIWLERLVEIKIILENASEGTWGMDILETLSMKDLIISIRTFLLAVRMHAESRLKRIPKGEDITGPLFLTVICKRLDPTLFLPPNVEDVWEPFTKSPLYRLLLDPHHLKGFSEMLAMVRESGDLEEALGLIDLDNIIEKEHSEGFAILIWDTSRTLNSLK